MRSNQGWDADRAQARIQELERLPGALLPILHALQDEFGYVDKAAIPLVARALNLSHAEVHGVVSFYHDFRHDEPGRHVLKMCRGLSIHGLREYDPARRESPGNQTGRDHGRSQFHRGSGVLPRELRPVSRSHARWETLRPGLVGRRRFPD